jgi:bifunctional oligoribonuclease and PAP phosphatase NrnA
MTKKPDWKSLQEFVHGKKRILITSHVHPDGDAIGSEIAMAEYLRQKGADVYIVNSDPTPSFFDFITGDQGIEQYNAEIHAGLIPTLDGCVVVDISDWARLKEIGRLVRQHQIPVACVDHHIPTDHMGQIQINIQHASSTGEVLYRFFKAARVTLNNTMVNALYLCVMTDTGSFRYSNTTPYALRMAADLLKRGAEFKTIYEQVYESDSPARMILKGRMLAELRFECQGRLAYFTLTQAMLQETGAEMWETEGFSELPRLIKGVEISIMFTETADGHIKISFRSKGHMPINGLAGQFGGGGHLYAAGATLAMPLSEGMNQVLNAARSYCRPISTE